MVYFFWPEKLHHFYCADLAFFYSMLKKVENWWKFRNKTSKILKKLRIKNNLTPPSPPLHLGHFSKKHHLPWRHLLPLCTQKKISPLPPLWKKPCPCVMRPTCRSRRPGSCSGWSNTWGGCRRCRCHKHWRIGASTASVWTCGRETFSIVRSKREGRRPLFSIFKIYWGKQSSVSIKLTVRLWQEK